MLYFALVTAAVVFGVAWLGVRAHREEYLLVLRWPDAGAVWLERRDGERYAPVSAAALPLAALRYGLHTAGARTARGAAADKPVAAPALAHR